MFIQARRIALITALSLGTGVCAAPALAAPIAQDGDHHDDHPEYSHNNYYRLGNREGLQDHHRNVQRPAHTHHYRNDTDRRAHDYGYQQGFSGTDYRHVDHDTHRDPH